MQFLSAKLLLIQPRGAHGGGREDGMRKICWAGLAVAGFLLGLAPLVHADSLQLKNGSFVQGTYLGGTERAVQFEVNGRVHLYDIGQILSISFAAASTDGGMPSNGAQAKPSSDRDVESAAVSRLQPACASGQAPKTAKVQAKQAAWKRQRRSAEALTQSNG